MRMGRSVVRMPNKMLVDVLVFLGEGVDNYDYRPQNHNKQPDQISPGQLFSENNKGQKRMAGLFWSYILLHFLIFLFIIAYKKKNVNRAAQLCA